MIIMTARTYVTVRSAAVLQVKETKRKAAASICQKFREFRVSGGGGDEGYSVSQLSSGERHQPIT